MVTGPFVVRTTMEPQSPSQPVIVNGVEVAILGTSPVRPAAPWAAEQVPDLWTTRELALYSPVQMDDGSTWTVSSVPRQTGAGIEVTIAPDLVPDALVIEVPDASTEVAMWLVGPRPVDPPPATGTHSNQRPVEVP